MLHSILIAWALVFLVFTLARTASRRRPAISKAWFLRKDFFKTSMWKVLFIIHSFLQVWKKNLIPDALTFSVYFCIEGDWLFRHKRWAGIEYFCLLFFLIQIKHPMSDDWYLDHRQTPIDDWLSKHSFNTETNFSLIKLWLF